MEPTLKEFGRTLAKTIPSMGPIKFIWWLRRNGYVKKSNGDVYLPTEKAEGLLGTRQLPGVYRGKRHHLQGFVTPAGQEFFTAKIEEDYKEFGHWELKR